MKIQVMGAYGSKAKHKYTTSFLIDEDFFIDAGNIINSNHYLENIILSHAHFDHITDIPFLLDNLYEKLDNPLKIYASKKTIFHLKNHIFNSKIWPEFHEISLLNKKEKSLLFFEIEENKPFQIKGHTILPFKEEHTVETFGFLIDNEVLISSDTYINENLINIIKSYKPSTLFLECSFPNRLSQLAKIAKHLTPSLIEEIEKKIDYSPNIYLYHTKPSYLKEIKAETKFPILDDYEIVDTKDNLLIKQPYNKKLILEIFGMFTKIAYANDIDTILEKVVSYAKKISNADGISLYLKTEDEKYLQFKIVKNTTLNINKANDVNWPKLPLYIDGKENTQMVAVLSALKDKVINIEDVYYDKNFNFEGTKKFDKSTGYRSKSMLVIPLKNHENEVIGVLQLINKLDERKHIIPFTKEDEKYILTLASIAAISLTKNRLIEDFEKLFESFIKTIGIGIDKKSKYTGEHVRKVAKLAKLIAKGIQHQKIKDYSDLELKTIEIAGWLHDIGKITVPEYVMDKATKLEKMVDRIDYIKYKFELYKKELEIRYLKKEISKEEYERELKETNEDFEFITQLNRGAEFVKDEDIEKLNKIAQKRILNETLLNEDEVKNLSIRKGTLTDEEREIIQSHAKNGIDMLTSIHYPKKYKRIPAIAGNHHEKLNCKGYPNQLCGEDLSLEERIMAVADIFEALSAADRPYKPAKTMAEIFKILYFMVKDNEIDKEIVKVILKENIHLKYAKEELKPFQINEIPEDILNYFLKDEK